MAFAPVSSGSLVMVTPFVQRLVDARSVPIRRFSVADFRQPFVSLTAYNPFHHVFISAFTDKFGGVEPVRAVVARRQFPESPPSSSSTISSRVGPVWFGVLALSG